VSNDIHHRQGTFNEASIFCRCEDYWDECEPSDLFYHDVEKVVFEVIFYYLCCYNVNLWLMQYCLLCC